MQICEAVDEGWIAGELLLECIAEVVRWVCGDNEHAAAHCCHLNGEAAGTCRFAHTALREFNSESVMLLHHRVL